jgi:rhodanese-related sulfurtransferase
MLQLAAWTSPTRTHQLIIRGSATILLGLSSPTVCLPIRSGAGEGGAREIDGQRILGAVHVAFDEQDGTLECIPRDRDVVVYCACPNKVTSVKVVIRLRERGIRRVRPLLDGIGTWVLAGFEIERI